jgi:hypothetical protein
MFMEAFNILKEQFIIILFFKNFQRNKYWYPKT